MSIGLTDELEVKTKKGKLAAAKQIFLEGDKETLQQIGDKTHQLEDAIKDITATGGASTANAVSYSNETSGMNAITAQGAIDELAAKNKTQDATIGTKAEKADVQSSVSELKAKNTSQDAEIAKKANSADVTSQMQTEQTRVNAELDKKFNKENIAKEFGDSEDKVVSQSALPFRYIQSEEFIFAKVDANDKLLFGFQWNGTPVFGKTSAVEDRLQDQVNLLADKIRNILGDDDTTSAIDTLKELKDFFASIDNTQTLTSILANLNSVSTKLGEDIKNLQDRKVDKEEGKSLIEDEVKECFRIISNDEFIWAVVDSEDRVLFCIYRDTGKPYYHLNEMYHVVQNEEFFALWLDANNHVVLGIKRDGEIIGEIQAVNTLKQLIYKLQMDIASTNRDLSTLNQKVVGIDTSLQELLGVISLKENPEYLAVETDADGHILATTGLNGEKSFNTPLHLHSSLVFKERMVYEEDVEDYKELLLDSKNNILRYVDKNNVVHENRETIFRSMKSESDSNESEISIPRTMNLPKYGYTNIVEETFYLTANAGYADKEGVLAMQVYEDTEENAKKGLTLFKYYVKSSLQNIDGVFSVKDDSIALDFYVPSSIKEVNGKSYVTSSLTKENDGSYSTNFNSIEVTKIVDKPNVQAWAVDKNSKHWCVVDIDFGSYLKGTYHVLVSFQGSSTLYGRKKNFRYAFVKDDYKTKVKLRIGELLRVDKFNLKSYSSDDTKLKEPIIFRLYLQTKELRNFKEQYPWSKSAIISTGATGIIKSFPVCTSVGGEFYGIQFFGYKKDKANYMLSKDADGMILSGGPGCTWDSFNWSTWEDEMNDEATESNRVAVEKFYNFINGADFTKENAPKHMNINDWIDYYIFIQLFRLRDNDIHNLILYSGKDKEIFSPFLYDLDLSFTMYKENLESDKRNTVWIKLAALYWDEICKRYWQLRKIVLNEYNFNAIVSDIQTNMDYSDFEKEAKKWGVKDANNTTSSLSDTFNELLSYFDLYFKK